MIERRIAPATAESRLARALVAAAAAAGVTARIAHHRSRPWASATFVGAQHRVALLAEASASLDTFVAALPAIELPLPGHVVASLAVDGVARAGDTATLAPVVLTLEDR